MESGLVNDQNKSFKKYSDEENIMLLAYAIWFIELSRKFKIPSILQFEILQKAKGLEGLWSYDLSGALNLDAKSVRVNNFIDRNSNNIIGYWNNGKIRNMAVKKAESVQDLKINAIDITNTDYPYRLRAVSSCPSILFYRGSGIAILNRLPFCVTVVGTRTPTPYGRRITEKFSSFLASYETGVISGLARGIDTIVHKTVLDKKGFTAAVLGCGPDIVYPPENMELQQMIAKQGLLISEHPPGVRPLRQFFPARNRILSGLSDAVIITESTSKSGTLITAGFAADQGRDVYAVPGSVLNKSSAGCHSLIRDGAMLIESADEVLSGRNCRLRNPDYVYVDETIKTELKTDIEIKIQAALSSMSLNLDELAGEINEKIETLAAVLTVMELNCKVTCHRGRYFLTESSSCCI